MSTQLDYIKTFIDAMDVTTTINHEGTVSSKKNAGVPPRIYVHAPEFVRFDSYAKEITYRYLMQWTFLTEATITTALKALIDIVDKLHRRATIAGYTKPATLVKAELKVLGSIDKKKSYWECRTYLEVVWSES